MQPDYETQSFTDSAAFRNWLDTHHQTKNGIWIKIYKKATGIATITHAEALDQALCYGWIDGMRKGLDTGSFLQKFTPRRPRSLWSKRNIEIIQRLTDAKLMQPAGIAEVDLAKADGRWEAAYDKPSEMQVPDYFQKALDDLPQAKAAFELLNKTNRYYVLWQLQTAKTDATRLRRQEKILTDLSAGKTKY